MSRRRISFWLAPSPDAACGRKVVQKEILRRCSKRSALRMTDMGRRRLFLAVYFVNGHKGATTATADGSQNGRASMVGKHR